MDETIRAPGFGPFDVLWVVLHYLIKHLGSFWGFTSEMPERGHHHDGAVEDWRICLLSVGPSSFRLFVLPVVMKSGSIKKSPPFFYKGWGSFYWIHELTNLLWKMSYPRLHGGLSFLQKVCCYPLPAAPPSGIQVPAWCAVYTRITALRHSAAG